MWGREHNTVSQKLFQKLFRCRVSSIRLWQMRTPTKSSLVPRRGEGRGGKGAPGVYCMRMGVNFPKLSENHITSGYLRYTDFCEVVDFYCVEDAYHNHALCEWWRGSNESTQLFGCKNDPCVCPFQLKATTNNDVIFPLKFTDASNKAMQTITVKAI